MKVLKKASGVKKYDTSSKQTFEKSKEIGNNLEAF